MKDIFISGRFLSLVGLREEYLVDELADELGLLGPLQKGRLVAFGRSMECLNTKR